MHNDSSVATDVDRLLRQAVGDPGSFTPRGNDYSEPLTSWCARAVLIALRSLPVEERMRTLGMVAVGWTYDDNPSGYFCGGPSNDYPPEHPHVYVDHDVAMRKENGGV